MRLEGTERGRRNAKRLRREMTPPEIGLWLALRNNVNGLRFRRLRRHLPLAGEDYEGPILSRCGRYGLVSAPRL